MRQELTEGQRVLMGELVHPLNQPQEPVQVHVHVGANGANNVSRFSLLALVGAITVGIIAYSLYQGQPVSMTVSQIESSLSAAMKPQWWADLQNWFDNKIYSPSTVMEVKG